MNKLTICLILLWIFPAYAGTTYLPTLGSGYHGFDRYWDETALSETLLFNSDPAYPGNNATTFYGGFIDQCDNPVHNFNWTLLNLSGTTYLPIKGFVSPTGGVAYASISCYYEDNFNTISGKSKVSADATPVPCRHTHIDADITQPGTYSHPWYPQIGSTWSGEKIGARQNSTLGHTGCFIIAAAVQLTRWGIDADPGQIARALRAAPDGYSGGSANGMAIARIYKVGYQDGRFKPMSEDEVQYRGMTQSNGVRGDSNGVAGHWVNIIHHDGGPGAYIIIDSMGYGWRDTKTANYPKGVMHGNNRMFYPIKGTRCFGTVLTKTIATATEEPALPEWLKPGVVRLQEALTANKRTVATTLTTAYYGPQWGGQLNGYTAMVDAGDVTMELSNSAGTVIATSIVDGVEDDITGGWEYDVSLTARDMRPGTYTLKVTGVPGTSYKVRIFDYVSFNEEPGATTIEGVIPAEGFVTNDTEHLSTVVLSKLSELDTLPSGTPFILESFAVIAKIGADEYSIQDNGPGINLPKILKLDPSFGTLNPFQGASDVTGMWVDGKLVADSQVMSTGGTLLAAPVFRTNPIGDIAAGHIYSKIVGIMKSRTSTTLTLDNGLICRTMAGYNYSIGEHLTLTGAMLDDGTFLVNTIISSQDGY